MNTERTRTFGAALVLAQGVVTAVAPQLSIRLIKRIVGKNFENAGELEAKPAYLRQLRAIGVGMVAAGGTDLLLQGLQADDSPAATDESNVDDESGTQDADNGEDSEQAGDTGDE